MGSYGIGPGRVVAAVVEQRHDQRGIVWPRSIAPFDLHVLALTGGEDAVSTLAAATAGELERAGYSVLLDDRDARPGEKFADADLVGAPLRVTVGRKSLEDDSVDVRARDQEGDERIARESVLKWAGDR
jgi:prolyl-tRNA synthetase